MAVSGDKAERGVFQMSGRVTGGTTDTRVLSDSPPPPNILLFLQEEEKWLFKRRRKADGGTKDNVHVELKPTLMVAQVVSLFPIYGVTNPDPSSLRFRWRSAKTAYFLLVFFAQITFWVLTVLSYTQQGMGSSAFGDIIFYGGTILISLFFLRLASEWKDFIGEWIAVQDSMSDLKGLSVRRTIKLVTILLTFSSILEHLLSSTETLINVSRVKGDTLKMFLETRHRRLYHIFSYSPVIGIVGSFFNLIITIIWNFSDIFLTVVSLALGKMFKQFTNDLATTSKHQSQETSLVYWRKRRDIYSRLAFLTKFVDDKLSVLVLMSFGVNLYYICIQLLHTIKPLKSVVYLIYFGCSFGHLLCRTCAVCFAASSIYENSKQPLGIIFSVPSEQYNVEVQRLQLQISSETLALTGCNFFTVTRTLMLTIAGTIVTYEIVLVQFKALNGDDVFAPAVTPEASNCSSPLNMTR